MPIRRSAAVPPIPGLGQVPYWTNATLFDLTEKPEHLLILGGGPIGLEMADAFAGLGCRVTLIPCMTAEDLQAGIAAIKL